MEKLHTTQLAQSAATDGQVLTYSTATGSWQPGAVGVCDAYPFNFTANAAALVPAHVAMTLAQGIAPLGTGTLGYEKSTAAAPSTFTTTSLPATLEAGAWLRVTASGVSGVLGVSLVRTA